MTKYALVGDVGSANAHLVPRNIASGEVSQAKTYSGPDYPSLEAVIRVYLEEHKVEVRGGYIAIACPITSDWVAMTNHTQTFPIVEMKKNLGLSHLETTNDFTAVSVAIPMLKKEHLIQFSGVGPIEGRPIAVYGVGAGLRVAYLVHVDKRWVGSSEEGGHTDFALNSEEEGIILGILRAEIGHVSVKHVLSGPGLVNSHRAIVKADNRLPENFKSKNAIGCVPVNNCTDCHRALSLFCVIMGRFGSDLALNLGTFGGVFIAGNIMPCFLEFFEASDFRAVFEDEGHFKEYVYNTPMYPVAHGNLGLLGSGAHLRQTSSHIPQILPVISGGNSPGNLLNHTVN